MFTYWIIGVLVLIVISLTFYIDYINAVHRKELLEVLNGVNNMINNMLEAIPTQVSGEAYSIELGSTWYADDTNNTY